MNLSFFECYQILEVSEHCDWSTLRKKYKTLIQKTHPDRFPENSAEHSAAEQKIRLYNSAYKVISDYYQANKKLPKVINKETEIKQDSQNQRKKRNPVNHQYSIHKKKIKPTKKIKRKILISTSLSVVIYIIFQYSFTPNPEQPVSTEEKTPNPDKLKPKSFQPEIKEHLIGGNSSNQRYFTIGASIGEVILIQGEPTHIDQDTWYYGLSSITFTNGLVSDWIRHPSNSLHIKRQKKPSYQLPSNNLNKKPLTGPKKPYWER